MLLALKGLWEAPETTAPAPQQGAAVLPRHIILEKLEEAAIIAAILAQED